MTLVCGKEVEEILNKHCNSKECEVISECIEGIRTRCSDFEEKKKLLLEGIEFGYNKANEWKYSSKGELPKVKGTWVIGFYYGKDNWHKLFYREDGKWWGEGQLCQPPYAWKEIVPPKEIEE